MRARALIVLLAGCDTVLGLDPVPAPKAYRKQITITQNTGATLTNFAVRVALANDPDLAAHAADSKAFRFTDLDGNTLPYEVVSFGPNNGSIESWVNVASLPQGQTQLWLEYGMLDYPDPQTPWFGAYAGVWHESRADNTEIDRTNNGHDLIATIPGRIPSTVPGIVGAARSYDGQPEPMCDGHINNSLDFGTNSFSYSLWVNVPALASVTQDPLHKGGGSAPEPGFDIEVNTSSTTAQVADGVQHLVATFGQLLPAQWQQLTVVFDRAQKHVFVYNDATQSGMQQIPSTFGSTSGTAQLCIGDSFAQTHSLRGMVDEVRVYSEALAPSRIQFENLMITQKDRVIAVGDEQPLR